MRRPEPAGPSAPASRPGEYRAPPRRTARRAGAGAAAATAVAGTLNFLARVVSLIGWVVALVIVAGIALVVFDANMSNSIVSAVHDAARTLASPFDGIFKPSDHKLQIALNWGLAALVYLVIARIIVRLLRR